MDPLIGGRAGRRLGLRLGVLLATAGVSIVGVGAWWTIRQAGRAAEGKASSDLVKLQEDVRAEIRELSQEIERGLAAFETVLRQDPEAAARLRAGGREASAVAREWSEVLAIEWLTLLNPDGRIVASAHWPEQVGLQEHAADRVVAGTAATLEVTLLEGQRLCVAARRDLVLEGRSYVLLGGRSLERVLPAWLPAPAWLFAEHDGPRLIGSVGTAGHSPELLKSALSAGADPESSASVAQGLRLGAIPLEDGAGRRVGVVVVATDTRAASRLVQGLWPVFGVLAVLVGVTGVVAGLWAGRRVHRPVLQLVRAVDAIAAGQIGYAFPRGDRDEFQELEAAFERMQRSLELELRRSAAAERIAAWRDAARHVAHEVKNPLAPIRLTVENLQRARREGSALFDELFEEGARTILEEVEQLRRLVGEFAEFARLPTPERRRLALEPLVDEVLELYASEPGLEVVRHYPGRASWVEADADQLGRALKNVVGNAVEAMREAPPHEPRRLEIAIECGSSVTLRIRDRGAGLTSEARQRLFEPYFTTKREGTGLGLAITHRIVTEHGGSISAERAGDRGTEIAIQLPRAVQEAGTE